MPAAGFATGGFMPCEMCRKVHGCAGRTEFLRRYFFRALSLREEVVCPDEEPLLYHGIEGVVMLNDKAMASSDWMERTVRNQSR